MPRRERPCVGVASRSRSSRRMAPAVAGSNPITVFISVVLPAPLRPMRPIIAPVGTSSDTPRSTCAEASETLKFRMLSMATHHVALHLRVGERDLRRGVGDDAAVVEGEHALREAADDFHVVLDEKYRYALRAHPVEHHLHDAELLRRGDAAGG